MSDSERNFGTRGTATWRESVGRKGRAQTGKKACGGNGEGEIVSCGAGGAQRRRRLPAGGKQRCAIRAKCQGNASTTWKVGFSIAGGRSGGTLGGEEKEVHRAKLDPCLG